ncbi:MAG: hypothetical protein HFI34_00765 [Lachnospiraceae bacterium]|nr:hypothetical protein [Lachnospiraceae bacterium]
MGSLGLDVHLFVPNTTKSEFHIRTGGIRSGKNKNPDRSVEQSYEQAMIENFKEQHSPENKRLQEICSKFRAGKELTAEELEYLAKHSPEMYKEVKEIMMEREAMELQMKLAKTKQEVEAVCMNKMTNIKDTMGTGETAEKKAMKTMAYTNQIAAAHIEFTASIEYREKEDEETQAEDRRESLEKSQKQLEEQIEAVSEFSGNQDTMDMFSEDIQGTSTEELKVSETAVSEKGSKAVDILRDIEKENDEQERERTRLNRKYRKSGFSASVRPFIQPDYESLWLKVRDLYGNSGRTDKGRMSETSRFNVLM